MTKTRTLWDLSICTTKGGLKTGFIYTRLFTYNKTGNSKTIRQYVVIFDYIVVPKIDFTDRKGLGK